VLESWPLPSGEVLVIARRDYEVPRTTREDLVFHRARLQHLRDTPTARARFGIFGFNDRDGSAFIVEAAVHPDAPRGRHDG